MGIERDQAGLQIAMKGLAEAEKRLKHLPSDEYCVVQMHGMLTVAAACYYGAIQRKESGGVHCRTDFPSRDRNNIAYHVRKTATTPGGIDNSNRLRHPRANG